METIQQNLETEARLKMEAVVVRKRLEQDITELEITLEGVNKARAEAEKNLKQSQQEVSDLETLLEEEQTSKFDNFVCYRLTKYILYSKQSSKFLRIVSVFSVVFYTFIVCLKFCVLISDLVSSY